MFFLGFVCLFYKYTDKKMKMTQVAFNLESCPSEIILRNGWGFFSLPLLQ